MNKYTELSDFEINKKVAVNIVGLNLVVEKNNKIYISEGDSGVIARFDPCTNPIQAMPIIIENNISLRAPTITDRWKAEFIDEYGNYVGYRRALNKNPLRAAMELFLLMKDAENEG
ncbi:hypothetical protein M2263_002363 [Providencia alcalifaciens]|nr:hypothetical protein [Providencia alcalifaciens]